MDTQLVDHATAQLSLDAKLCYGVGCERHARCARYLAVDGAHGDRRFIGSCLDGKEFPLFVDILRTIP